MNILLIGGGGREHAIAEALAKDSTLYSLMPKKNPAIANLSKDYAICDIENPEIVKKTIKEKKWKIDLGFASPDSTLAAGISDALESLGILIASPKKSAARIEWDKFYIRELSKKYNILGSPINFLIKNELDFQKLPIDSTTFVIKPLGLSGGKGVKVGGIHFQTNIEAKNYCIELINKDGSVLIEEKIEGEEFSLQCFCDGKNLSFMPPIQDHKLAFENDMGPNTGGMGSYSTGDLLPFITNKDLELAKSIIVQTIEALRKEKNEFRGVLYGQFMTTKDGVYLIEYNSRFGDPEAINAIPLLETSLSQILLSIAKGNLIEIKFSKDETVVKYLVPSGYPDKSKKDQKVMIDQNKIQETSAHIYYSSVYAKDGLLYTSSSRSFAILGRAKSIDEAEKIAEAGCKCIYGPLWHRKDIGTKELIEKRINHMKKIKAL